MQVRLWNKNCSTGGIAVVVVVLVVVSCQLMNELISHLHTELLRNFSDVMVRLCCYQTLFSLESEWHPVLIRLMHGRAYVHQICHMILTSKIIMIKQAAAIECHCRRFLSILILGTIVILPSRTASVWSSGGVEVSGDTMMGWWEWNGMSRSTVCTCNTASSDSDTFLSAWMSAVSSRQPLNPTTAATCQRPAHSSLIAPSVYVSPSGN